MGSGTEGQKLKESAGLADQEELEVFDVRFLRLPAKRDVLANGLDQHGSTGLIDL